jgi:hypothetical protein
MEYIDKNNKKPSENDKDDTIKKIGKWLSHQKNNYKNKIQNMKNEMIYDLWTQFINDDKYKKYFISNETSWKQTLNQLQEYINKHCKIPSCKDKNDTTKKLSIWTSRQKQIYKRKIHIMENELIYDLWTQFINDDKYKIYFISNVSCDKNKHYIKNDITHWKYNLKLVAGYINKHDKLPNPKNNKLGIWIHTQKHCYKRKIQIMKNESIYDLWTKFIINDKYKQYFFDHIILWNQSFEQLKTYINKYNKLPSRNINETKQLSLWICSQKKNYKIQSNIMKHKSIYNIWTQFINDDKYKKYFIDNVIHWNQILNQVKEYIDEHNKRPTSTDKNDAIKKLSKWIIGQKTNYEKKTQIMKNESIYNLWTQFINDDKYKKYFISNETSWKQTLNELQKYINKHNKTPSQYNKDNTIKILGNWLYAQKNNYKKKIYIMKNESIYNLWTQFINDDKYKKYFISNETSWKQTLNQLQEYINKHDKTPSQHDKNDTIKILGYWLNRQITNYLKKIQIMKNESIYNLWTQFINDDKYKKYFKNHK